MHYYYYFSHWSLNCDSYLQLTGQKADLSMKGSPYWMAPEVLLVAISTFYYINFCSLEPHLAEIIIFFPVAHDGCHAER